MTKKLGWKSKGFGAAQQQSQSYTLILNTIHKNPTLQERFPFLNHSISHYALTTRCLLLSPKVISHDLPSHFLLTPLHLIYRPGIIFMSTVIGCWELLKSFVFFFVFRDTFKRKTFFYMISYLGRFVTLIAGFAFLYSGYLAYKVNRAHQYLGNIYLPHSLLLLAELQTVQSTALPLHGKPGIRCIQSSMGHQIRF